MSLLKKDTTKKRRMNKLFSEPEPEFDAGNNKEYKVEVIKNSVIYAKKAEGHLPGLYYLISWKRCSEKKKIWKPFFTVMQLWKIISTFHKDHPEKPMTNSSCLDSALPMAKLLIKPVNSSAKQK